MSFYAYKKYDPRRLQPLVWLGHKLALANHSRIHSAEILCSYRHPLYGKAPGGSKGSFCMECKYIVNDWEWK